MQNILIFAGTYEGRKLCEDLSIGLIGLMKITVCVATDYGKELLENIPNIEIHSKRLTQEEMEIFIKANRFDIVIDCTHPYAKEVTKNIQSACEKATTEYIRMIREEKQYSDIITVESTLSAVEYLKNTSGNILVTTGSKELHLYCEIPNFAERLYARVLANGEVIEHCNNLGFKGVHIIGMQGPFSYEMNVAMLNQFHCSYLVTKNTGTAGGIDEKILAAQQTDTKVILIDRPTVEVGFSYEQVLQMIKEKYQNAEC